MSIQSLTRHPALWLSASLLVGGLAFQAGRATPTTHLTARNAPIITRPASFVNEGVTVASSLRQLDGQFADLVEQISPAVVHIRTSVNRGSYGDQPLGQGSGVIIRPDGWIVTNDHVVNGSSSVTVILSNGKEYTGKVIESDDNRNDVAVIKIDANNLPVAKFANSGDVRPGEYAIAVGAPFGLENTVTIGHISAIGRMNAAGNGQGETRAYSNMIQTDAPINPGNSGGPLLNIDGEIVGINTSIYSGMSMGGGQSAGIGFAIPSNQVSFIADLLISKKALKRGYLNIAMDTLKPYEIEEMNLAGGVRVGEAPAGGAAAKAGVKKGDIITKVGSYAIRDDQDLLNALLRYAPGEKVDVQIVRGTKAQTLALTVDAAPLGQRAPVQAPEEEAGPGSPFRLPNLPDLMEPFQREREQETPNTQPSEPRNIGAPARLGVQFQDVDAGSRRSYRLPTDAKGAVVMSVEPGSVAADLGLKTGDLITRLGSTNIVTGADLVTAVKKYKVGDDATIIFSRFADGQFTQITQSVRF